MHIAQPRLLLGWLSDCDCCDCISTIAPKCRGARDAITLSPVEKPINCERKPIKRASRQTPQATAKASSDSKLHLTKTMTKMADQSSQKSRPWNNPFAEAAKIFAGPLSLVSAICLLSLCSGCHLRGERPGSIRFVKPDASLSNPRVSQPRSTRDEFINQPSKSKQRPQVGLADFVQATEDSSEQKSDEAKIALASYVQDDDLSSRRLELRPEPRASIALDDFEDNLTDAESDAEVGDTEIEAVKSMKSMRVNRCG